MSAWPTERYLPLQAIRERLRQAYFLGFAQSGDGFNSEEPFDPKDTPEDDPHLNEQFESWLAAFPEGDGQNEQRGKK